MKRVLNVGQCGPDHGTIRRLIEGEFDAQVTASASADDAAAQLRASPFDLVLVNRRFDADDGDGLSLIRAIKTDPALAAMPVMLVSNYADAQEQAIAAGAEPGFGKARLGDPATRACLARFLAPET